MNKPTIFETNHQLVKVNWGYEHMDLNITCGMLGCCRYEGPILPNFVPVESSETKLLAKLFC